MLDNIKSLFILKKIFYQLSEMIKLNYIVHNKNLKHKLDIDIIDYRRISGRYIIDENKGKGKEYNSYNNKLIYEGEYLNRKRHGLGKLYNDEGNLIFEGEYLNGKINGKGKKYYNNGRIQYEGEFLNEKMNGKGKEYNKYGEIIYEGEYLNGKINGKGKEYYDNGKLEYEGEYFNGKKYGKGKEYNKNEELIYDGYFLYNHILFLFHSIVLLLKILLQILIVL